MKLDFNLVGSGTWVLNVDNKFKIGCDPALAPKGTKYIYKGLKTSRVVSPVYDEATFNNVKLWLITHGHFDHIDRKGLEVIKNGTKIVSHKNANKLLKKKENIDITYIKWDEAKTYIIDGYKVKVIAVPAIHGMNTLAKLLMGGVNGYLITIKKGNESKSLYATSDAVYSDEIVERLKNKSVDILVANLGQAKSQMIGGPFTMNIDMLNKFIKELNPKVILPIHINDFEHFETTNEELENIINKDRVVILQSGESTTI